MFLLINGLENYYYEKFLILELLNEVLKFSSLSKVDISVLSPLAANVFGKAAF
jgi:hypothetical protein